MTNSNAFFDDWAPLMVVDGVAYVTDGTVRHSEGMECTEDGRTISNLAGDADWTPVEGLSGQHGYSGPIMDPSEYLSGHTVSGLEDGLYQCVPVDYIGPCVDGDDFDECTCESAIGWALMRYTGPQDN